MRQWDTFKIIKIMVFGSSESNRHTHFDNILDRRKLRSMKDFSVGCSQRECKTSVLWE